MALIHNVIIRGMNSMYLQAEHVRRNEADEFLTFCQCWSELLHNHHHCEERAYFPVIERACGFEGIAEENVDQHEVFMHGLHRFDDYVYKVGAADYRGKELVEILDGFCADLQMHLTDEILWIQSLSKYPNLDLEKIDKQHAEYIRSRASKTRIMPVLLSNHDITYEDGIHKWWPAEQHKAADFFLRYMWSLWNRKAWAYSSCALSGKPKRLHALKHKVGLSSVEIFDYPKSIGPQPQTPERPIRPAVDMIEMPERAHTRRSSRSSDSIDSPDCYSLTGSTLTGRTSMARLASIEEKCLESGRLRSNPFDGNWI